MTDAESPEPTADLPSGAYPQDASATDAGPCRHLRSKGMYVYTDGQAGHAHEDYDNTVYWCLKTMKDFGPDDEFVGGSVCRNPARPCYQPV